MIKTYFDYTAPDQKFWEAYARLWENSSYQSAFQAPHYIQYLMTQAKGTLAVYKHLIRGELVAAAFFHKSGGEYGFLSDLKADHNFFIIHKKCGPEETAVVFAAFIKKIENEKLALRLNSQPVWAEYMDALIDACKAGRLFWVCAKYTTCLTVEESTPEALFQRTNKQKLRQKLNGLKELGEVSFEAFTDDTDWDNWLNDFFQTHIDRWEDTPTPSAYRSLQKQQFIDGCLRAWLQDRLLVRFSIKLEGKRIAFVVGVIEKNSLIHHSTAHDNAFNKYSPGLVLIRLIGKWMEEHRFTKLDFGDGNEAYKYLFAKKEEEAELNTIFLSSPANIAFILKAKLVKTLKENAGLQKLYQEKIRSLKYVWYHRINPIQS
jgi:Acetyltransferase (GNAT) domain